MKKAVSGHNRSSQQTTSKPRRTQPHSQPTQQLPTTSKSTKREDVRDCLKNSYVCTRLLAKNPHVYMDFGQKPVYTEKTVVKSRPRVKPIKGSVNG